MGRLKAPPLQKQKAAFGRLRLSFLIPIPILSSGVRSLRQLLKFSLTNGVSELRRKLGRKGLDSKSGRVVPQAREPGLLSQTGNRRRPRTRVPQVREANLGFHDVRSAQCLGDLSAIKRPAIFILSPSVATSGGRIWVARRHAICFLPLWRPSVSGMRGQFTDMWSCRSMFTCCSASRRRFPWQRSCAL